MSEQTTPTSNDQATRPRRLWWKVLRTLLLGLAFLLLFLQLPFVQNFLAQRVVNRLENTLETRVSLDRVYISWLDELNVEGLYLEDIYGDTLLASGKLVADFNLNPFAIYQRGIEIEALELEGAQFNIQRKPLDTLSNLEYALRRLFKPKPVDTTEQKRSLPLNLSQLHLANVRFSQSDSVKGSYLDVLLEDGQVYLNSMDIDSLNFDIRSVNLRRPRVLLANWNSPLPALEQLDSIVQVTVQSDSSAINLDLGELMITEGRFKLDNFRKASTETWPPDQLDLKHLDLFDIQVEIEGLNIDNNVYQGRVNWIAAKDESGFQLTRLSAREAVVSDRELTLNGLHVITPTSELGDTLRFRYRGWSDWAEFTDRVRMDLRFHDADVTLKDIIAFVPKLNNNVFFDRNRNTNLQIDGKVSGRVNSLNGKNLAIRLADGTRLEGGFSSRNLSVKQEEFLILDLKQLSTRVSTLRQLLPNFNPPDNFNKLGRLDFQGEFVGFFIDFVANGNLVTDLGRARLDMQMKLKDGPDRARYAGGLVLEDFDLGQWSENSAFGSVNLRANVKDGFGLSGSTASANLTAAVESFTFRDYTYENANLTGQLNANFFNGSLGIQDDNIDFGFNGTIDFTDEVPKFDFRAQVNKLAMLPLNLSKQDITLAGVVDLQLENTKIADIEGEINLQDFSLLKAGDDQIYTVEYLQAYSFFADNGEKVFRLNSDIAKGEIRGNYNIDDLPGTFQLWMLRNYPGFAERLKVKPPKNAPDSSQFVFDFHLNDSKGLNYLVDAGLAPIQGLDLKGKFDSTTDSLYLSLDLPVLQHNRMRFDDIYFDFESEDSTGYIDLIVGGTTLGEKKLLSEFKFYSFLASDSLRFGINLSTDQPTLLDKIDLNGSFTLVDSTAYALQLRQSQLSLFEEPWVIQDNNRIQFGQGLIEARDFVLSNGEQRIAVRNNGPKGLRFQFNKFAFSFIDQVWKYDPLDFEGEFDLLLQVDDIFKMQGLNAVLTCDDFRINQDDYGRFSLEAYAPQIKDQATGLISMRRDTTFLEAEVTYNMADLVTVSRGKIPVDKRLDYLDIKARGGGLPLDIVTYWIRTGLSNTYGVFEADLHVFGLTDQLAATGGIDAYHGGFTIDALQTHYTFDKGHIEAREGLFDATGTIIHDKYNNSALVEGGITHKNLRQLGLAASMRTRRFLGLDLKKGDNDLFYGRAFGAGQVRFSGDFKRSNIYVDAVVQDSTILVLPITDQSEAGDLDFVKFVNKKQQSQTTQQDQSNRLEGLNLEMDLAITEAAELELIFDEKAGDILRGRGRGNLRILLPRADDFQMYGEVTVTTGQYLFTLYDVINKDFKLLPGGKISWNGDPINAQIDIAAQYKDLKTSLTTLLQEYLVNAPESEQQLARQATDVDLILELEGELFSPDIKFDIDFPNLQGVIANLADNKLNLLRQEQDEMNKQVFGLIVLGQFLPSDLSFNSTEVFSNTLSEYFSNQLSLLLTDLFSDLIGNGKTISSLDVEVAYNRISADNLTSGDDTPTFSDAVEINLRSGLFDERVSVDIGGNFEFGQTAQNGAFFGENLVLEYALNQSGDLKIRLYERRDQDIGGGRRIQVGTGLTWRREFTSFSDFWQSLKRKK